MRLMVVDTWLFISKKTLKNSTLLLLSLSLGILYAAHVYHQEQADWQILMSPSVDKHHATKVIGYIDGYIQSTSWGEQMPFTVDYYLSAPTQTWMIAPGHPKVWLSVFGDGATMPNSLQSGDAVQTALSLKPPIPGGFADALKRKGIGLEADTSVSKLQKLPTTMPADPNAWQGLVQQWLESRVIQAYGMTSAAFLLSFSIGDHMKLASALVATFVAMGVVHAVVASGATIRMTVTPVVRYLITHMTRRVQWLIVGITLTIGMVFLTAFAPPATRAAIVYGYDLLAIYFRKPRDFFTSNAFSLAAMAVIQPEWLFDPGVIFSYAAAAAIHVLPQLFSSTWFYRVKSLRTRKLISKAMALQLGVSPFVAFEFGQFPYYSLIINLFLYPVLEWAIPISTLLLLLGCVNPLRMSFLRQFLDLVFIPLSNGLHVLSTHPLNLVFSPPSIWIEFAYLAVMILSIWQIRRYNLRKISKYSNG
jgi:ComEC/Rec2-related protein